MIFYFSATGNSLYAAKKLAEYSNENLVSIAASMTEDKDIYEYTLGEDEVVGFVCPVYAWTPPKIVTKFIEKIKFKNYKGQHIFAVITCGENVGNAIDVIKKTVEKRGLLLSCGFSVIMPNNYIVMGDVDSKEVQEKKLANAEEVLKNIGTVINTRKDGIYKATKGLMPYVRTSVIGSLFNKSGANTKKFHVGESCISCGLCEKVCSIGTIKFDGKPTWGEECMQCLACINLCPAQAIQYGKSTIKKGRYKNPNISVEELKLRK